MNSSIRMAGRLGQPSRRHGKGQAPRVSDDSDSDSDSDDDFSDPYRKNNGASPEAAPTARFAKQARQRRASRTTASIPLSTSSRFFGKTKSKVTAKDVHAIDHDDDDDDDDDVEMTPTEAPRKTSTFVEKEDWKTKKTSAEKKGPQHHVKRASRATSRKRAKLSTTPAPKQGWTQAPKKQRTIDLVESKEAKRANTAAAAAAAAAQSTQDASSSDDDQEMTNVIDLMASDTEDSEEGENIAAIDSGDADTILAMRQRRGHVLVETIQPKGAPDDMVSVVLRRLCAIRLIRTDGTSCVAHCQTEEKRVKLVARLTKQEILLFDGSGNIALPIPWVCVGRMAFNVSDKPFSLVLVVTDARAPDGSWLMLDTARECIFGKHTSGTARATVVLEFWRKDEWTSIRDAVAQQSGRSLSKMETIESQVALCDILPDFGAHVRAAASVEDRLADWRKGRQRARDARVLFTVGKGRGAVRVSDTDLKSLEPGTYVNDAIIDAYIKYQVEQGSMHATVQSECHFFSSLFFKQYQGTNRKFVYERVRRWTKDVDVFSKRHLFVPIIENAHWTLAVVYNAWSIEKMIHGKVLKEKDEPLVLYLDSLSMIDSRAENHLGSLRKWLAREWIEHRHGEFSKTSPKKVTKQLETGLRGLCMKVPQQENGCDCGIFVIKYMLHFYDTFLGSDYGALSQRRPWFSQVDIDIMRDLIHAQFKTLAGVETAERQAQRGGAAAGVIH